MKNALILSHYHMKYAILFSLLIIFVACNNSDKLVSPDEKITVISADSSSQDSSKINNRTDAIWTYKFDSTIQDYKPFKQRAVLKDTLTAQMICSILNHTWPDIQVLVLKSSNDTLFVSIPQSDYLTQQMGTTGAMEYMVTATYSFTELKGIKYVSFDFNEGDHAVPGVYDRTSWDLKLQ